MREITFADLGCTNRERALFDEACARTPSDHQRVLGRVVKLDRGYPLVCHEGGLVRAEHAISLVKGADLLSCVGDWVVLELPEANTDALICELLPRTYVFARKDPANRTGMQTLAANIDLVLVLHALSGAALSKRRLEREMVVAHESGADVAVVLTKADLATSLEEDIAAAREAAPGAEVIVESAVDGHGVDEVRSLIPSGKTAVLLGGSGVGKSSLVNVLIGEDVLEVGAVREGDDQGRHTTVSRQMLALPGGGAIVDIPGIRTVGLWDSERGMRLTFPEIAEAAASCRFRDCTHEGEPGCAVKAAVKEGRIARDRFEAYLVLEREMAETAAAREERERIVRRQKNRRR